MIYALLPTDWAFLGVLLGALALSFFLVRKAAFRRPLLRVLLRPSAMVSLLVLFLFLTIAVMDCVRFQSKDFDGDQVKARGAASLTLLDLVLSPLRNKEEKTYSEPLAIFAYAKALTKNATGQEQWIYPRLLWGGVHLKSPEDHRIDLYKHFTQGGLRSLIGFSSAVVLIGGGLVIAFRLKGCSWSEINQSVRKHQALWVILGTAFFFICIFVFLGAEFSKDYHFFGTDKVGGDVFYASLKSIRTALVIGVLATVATLPIALLFGVIAGYFRGWADDLIQFVYTTLNAVPGVLLMAACMLVMDTFMRTHESSFSDLISRADFRLMALCLILGLTSWTGLCRLVRAETMKLRELEFIQAARVLGVSHFRILTTHIIPNLFHIILISTALDFSSLVLAEAVLSYINIGVDPATYSWGNMINGARLELAREPPVWWSLCAAFFFMFLMVLSANVLSDAIRDAFDPRLDDLPHD